MAKTDVLIDAGPLIAFFDRRDQHHAWTKTQMAHLTTPLYACEAVLSEAFHLLEHVPGGTQQLIRFLERGAVAVPFSYANHAEHIHEIMNAYADQPMSFADACLVQMAERQAVPTIFTIDSDFQVYRSVDGEPLNVLIPGV